MKRITALFLTLVVLLSLTACGSTVPAETETPETVPANVGEGSPVPETEPPTEAPTLSPEEILYDSLPDRMKQAVDVGIVELSQLEDLERIVTVGEAAEMLQKAYVHRTGVESMTLNDMITQEVFSTRTADRAWISAIPGHADLELAYGDRFESYEQWIDFQLDDWQTTGDLNSGFDDRLGMIMPVVGDLYGWEYRYNADSDTIYGDTWGNTVYNGLDYVECWEAMWNDPLYAPLDSTHAYGFKVYDSTNGKKFISMEDGYFNGWDALTLEESVECALVYYNFPNPMEYAAFVAPEDMGSYNPEIITPDLLDRETDLPAVSSEKLPKEWHGVVVDDLEMIAYNMHTDREIYAYELQKIKEAGFNYIGLNLDFSWLQDYWLFNTKNNNGRNAYVSLMDPEDDGNLSVERLETLDRIIAWCMKNDIHVNLRATALGKTAGHAMDMAEKIRKGSNYASELAQLWQAVARRYAEIPNEYLSFTLFTTGSYEVKNEMLIDSVAAIREVSPDRCIIADICTDAMNSEEFAKLGVALSYRLRDSEKHGSIFKMNDYYKYSSKQSEMRLHWLTNHGKTVIESFSWPYKGEMDADVLFSSARKKGENLTDVMATAQKHGVGFMLSEFGVSVDQEARNANFAVSRLRYADEPYFAMITDIATTMEDFGYGWCFAHWYSPYGVAFCLPAVKTSTYEQIEDYPYYIDQGMMDLFQKLNGIR